MRESLKKYLDKSIIFEYSLPNKGIAKTKITTLRDVCYSSASDNNISTVIYNGIVDYALGEKNVDFSNLNKEQLRAINLYMRYDENDLEETKERYGFYGEVVLTLILQKLLQTKIMIAKGYFYNILDSQETHGFDAFHCYYNKEKEATSVVLGEAKFRANQSAAIKSVINSISTVLTEDYINKNFKAIVTKINDADNIPEDIKLLFERLLDDPDINFYELLKENNIRLVYPVLIMCDQNDCLYDKRIKSMVDSVDYYLEKIKPITGISIDIFFIFLPVNDTKAIKKDVIKWITEKKPLSL